MKRQIQLSSRKAELAFIEDQKAVLERLRSGNEATVVALCNIDKGGLLIAGCH